MRPALALCGAVVVTHQLYRRWPDIALQQWVFYVCSNALAVLTFALLLQRAPSGAAGMLWSFACWLGIIEAGQCAGCGVLEFGNAAETDLCIQALGQDGYTAIACGVIAAVLTYAWRRRHGRA